MQYLVWGKPVGTAEAGAMGRGAYGIVARQVQRLFHAGTITALDEGQLLERFVDRGDETAFDALVARHGPMVLGVCRRFLHDPNDVDDAFQATFLILVRKAPALRSRDLLGAWLYGVAYRVAVRARQQSRRQRSLGHDLAGPSGMPDIERREVGEVVHDELNRLPEKYRVPIVLCHLEGLSHHEAAARLAWPVGTVRGRLARGRDLLRDRLNRRGMHAHGVAFGSLLGRPEPVPPHLSTMTVAAVSEFGAQGARAGAVSARALALTQGVLDAMLGSQLKTIAAATLAFGLVTFGAGVLAQHGSKPAPRAVVPRSGPAVPAAKDAPREVPPADNAADRDALAARIDAAEAQIELLEIENEADKAKLMKAMDSVKGLEARLARPIDPSGPRLSSKELEHFRQLQRKQLTEVSDTLAYHKERYLEGRTRLLREKRRLADLQAKLVERPGRGVTILPTEHRATNSEPDISNLEANADDLRAEIEVMALRLLLEKTRVERTARYIAEWVDRPNDIQQNKDYLEKVKLSHEEALQSYREANRRLSEKRRQLAKLEARLAPERVDSATATGMERRLATVEAKLDQILEALERREDGRRP